MYFAGKFSQGTRLQEGALLDLSSILSVMENAFKILVVQGKMQLRSVLRLHVNISVLAVY